MICPNCQGQLIGASLPGQTIYLDSCSYCGGIWFDGGELSRYERTGRDAGSTSPALPDYDLSALKADELHCSCPRCVTLSVQTASTPEVTIGRCLNCSGVFVGPTSSAMAPGPLSDTRQLADLAALFVSGLFSNEWLE